MPSPHLSPAALTAALKEEAQRLGFTLVGATPAATPPRLGRFHEWLARGYAGQMHYMSARADAYRHPRHVLAEVRSILMLGTNYRTVEPAAAGLGQGRVSRYAWGADYHELIRRRLHRLADFHRRLVPQGRVRGVVDTAPLLEREFGQLAGLGWIGKNTLLVNRQLGSWFFLAALLTSEELEHDEPAGGDRCGACCACLDACPTGALVEPYWLDARKCLSYLTIELHGCGPPELRGPQGDRLFGCDACQEACPFNRRTPSTAEPAFQPRPGMNPVELAELFTLDEAAFRSRFHGTPLWRPKRRGILRNAAVALGNRPVPAALPALLRGLQDGEPVVRTACAWALGRYSNDQAKQALRERLAVEPDPAVRAEIESALYSAPTQK
jgi:epoxyqueuosine reductase